MRDDRPGSRLRASVVVSVTLWSTVGCFTETRLDGSEALDERPLVRIAGGGLDCGPLPSFADCHLDFGEIEIGTSGDVFLQVHNEDEATIAVSHTIGARLVALSRR